ncbi:hypothetical protein [Ruegeria sp. HKCCD8929]|uniref:hypothetical protein n=1 Tax=Ruegeria sp. HKCCD8929 TaxID=2683006 RepID=UPI001488AC7B|nr:hypothetical protein [Ruegeria sp. HKCCD8929]
MAKPDVTVEITFFLPDGEAVSEADAARADPSRFGVSYHLEGSLDITAGEVMATVEDALLYMVPGLCFDAVAQLRDTGEAEFASWSSDERLTLRRDGDEIEIKGVYLPPVRFPADALEAGLLAAGLRFVELRARVWPDEAAEDTDSLNERAAAAQAALEGGGAG